LDIILEAGGAGGYRNSYNSEASGGGGSSETSLTFETGTVYTITVGAGGLQTLVMQEEIMEAIINIRNRNNNNNIFWRRWWF
jgi:hypothetical protein